MLNRKYLLFIKAVGKTDYTFGAVNARVIPAPLSSRGRRVLLVSLYICISNTPLHFHKRKIKIILRRKKNQQ